MILLSERVQIGKWEYRIRDERVKLQRWKCRIIQRVLKYTSKMDERTKIVDDGNTESGRVLQYTSEEEE